MLSVCAVNLPFLRAVDAVEANAFRVLVVENFNRIAVKDRDDGARKVGSGSGGAKQHQERAERKDIYSFPRHMDMSGGATKTRTLDEIEPSVYMDDGSLHSFCG